jgi:hypothetical protein
VALAQVVKAMTAERPQPVRLAVVVVVQAQLAQALAALLAAQVALEPLTL